MEVQVNIWAVLLAFVSSMVVGSIWYSRGVFGDKWMKLIKLEKKDIDGKWQKAMAVMVVASLAMAYVLAHVTYISHAFFGNSFLQDALTTAFWMWLGFQGLRMLMHDTYEQRPPALTWMNIGNSFVTIMLMGLIIGLMGV